MNFDNNEEQRLLAASIARFVERDYGFARRRSIIASAEGYSNDAWKAFADLGLLGLPVPSEFGGFGGGAVDAAPVMEAIGEALIVEPYLATIGLGARFVAWKAYGSSRATPAGRQGSSRVRWKKAPGGSSTACCRTCSPTGPISCGGGCCAARACRLPSPRPTPAIPGSTSAVGSPGGQGYGRRRLAPGVDGAIARGWADRRVPRRPVPVTENDSSSLCLAR